MEAAYGDRLTLEGLGLGGRRGGGLPLLQDGITVLKSVLFVALHAADRRVFLPFQVLRPGTEHIVDVALQPAVGMGQGVVVRIVDALIYTHVTLLV